MASTALELITELRYELKDTTAPYNYSDVELLAYLSDAVEDAIAQITGQWPDYWLRTNQTQLNTQTITAAQQIYNLPAGCRYVIAVTAKDATGATTELNELDLQRTFDTAADGYFLRNDKVYIYPIPTATVANGLDIYYIGMPTRLAAVGETVALSDDFRGYLKQYVMIRSKARQEESGAAFAALFGRLADQAGAIIARTNLGKFTSFKIPWRRLI